MPGATPEFEADLIVARASPILCDLLQSWIEVVAGAVGPHRLELGVEGHMVDAAAFMVELARSTPGAPPSS